MHMPVRDRTIGGQGGQTAPNMGNDYSRNISRETQEDDSIKVITGKNKKNSKDRKATKDVKRKNSGTR